MSRDRKLDRFDDLALAAGYPDYTVDAQVAAKLLRREHAALVRAVKRLKVHFADLRGNDMVSRNDVLALLAQRKGKKIQ